MPVNDQTHKSNQNASLSRPVSMSSQDSEESSSTNMSPYDLTALEKDSEILARKAAKRFKKNFSTQSESFVEKFISWHRKKKVDKIKCSLESLFPKLKNSEVAVKNWLATVSERKEVAWLNGNALLNDMETQIVVYQKHLDFLDEVVNDIRQIDYDILKEVSELRIAFAFNQELLMRASPKLGTSAACVTIKSSERGGKVLLIAIDPAPPLLLPVCPPVRSLSIGEDLEQEELLCTVDHSTRPVDAPVPQATPAVWHGITSEAAAAVPSVLASDYSSPVKQLVSSEPITAIFTSITSGKGDSKGDVEPTMTRKLRDLNAADGAPSIAVSRSGRISPKSATGKGVASSPRVPAPSAAICVSPRLDACGDPVLMWDGEESKRKSLTLSCVSLQSLKLGDSAGVSSAESPVNKRSSWGLGSSSSDKTTKSSSSSSSFLGAKFTRGRSGTTNSMNIADGELSRSRGSWGKRDSDTASALLHKRGAWSSPLSVLSPRTADSGVGPRTPNELRCESSSDESCNSLSDSDTDEACGSMLGDMESFSGSHSGDSVEMSNSPGKKKQRSSKSQGASESVINGKVLPRKLSLQKLLQKVDSGESAPPLSIADTRRLSSPPKRGSGDDPDQLEMGKRIKKCLMLKDTLKSVLSTVQGTQDTETCVLRKMKKLRNELKTICSAETDPSASKEVGEGGPPFYSLCRQTLLNEANSGNEYSSGSNSVPSSNNLQGLGYASDHGSDDSIGHTDPIPRMRPDSKHLGVSPQQLVSPLARATPPIGAHITSANIPIIPPAHHLTSSQSAAVAVSGVAAFSFMTSATTGSDEGGEDGAAHEERLSIGSNSTFGEDLDFQEAALECVDGLKSLIQQEAEAKGKLAKLASLIDAASIINQQLQLNVASVVSSTK